MELLVVVLSLERFHVYRINISPQIEVMCSVNGLFYLRCTEIHSLIEDNYVFWNPSTDKVQLIPHPDSRYLPCTCESRRCKTLIHNSACGLGFVAESQDYKFVRFMINTYSEFHTEGGLDYEHDRSNHVAVYSSKNDSWKEVHFPFRRGGRGMCPKHGSVATCVDGFCYWISEMDAILSFDLSSDEFSTLPYPDDIQRDAFSIERDVFILELDGSLCLVIQFQLESEITTKLFSFWVYESSSISSLWTRKIDLDVRLAAKKPLWLGKKKNNSLVLLLQGVDNSLLEYNYATIELKKIQDGHPDRMMMISPYVGLPYVETENDENNGVDRISQLPDDIILSILSLLSLEEASFTSVLSTRWRDLWRHIPNLVFRKIDNVMMMRDKDMYTKCVNSVVESHKAPCFKEFNISLPLNNSIRRRTLTKWLELAFSRGVEVLVLNLAGTRFGFLEKSFLLKSTNLTSLSLKCMKVSGESIRLVLRSCPLLELLIIKFAVLKSDLEVCSSALKHLDIQYCRGGKSIIGYAPNLTYLRFDSGRYLCWDYREQPALDPPLIRLTSSTLTTLEFPLHCPVIFVKNGFPEMPTLKKLIITHYDCTCSTLCPITSLLRALPNLEEFEIKQQQYISNSKKKCEEAVNNVERFCHHHLRVFEFTCFEVGDGNHMELMSYILDNCVALQKIILHNYGRYSLSGAVDWEYVKQLLSKLPSNIQLIIN